MKIIFSPTVYCSQSQRCSLLRWAGSLICCSLMTQPGPSLWSRHQEKCFCIHVKFSKHFYFLLSLSSLNLLLSAENLPLLFFYYLIFVLILCFCEEQKCFVFNVMSPRNGFNPCNGIMHCNGLLVLMNFVVANFVNWLYLVNLSA